MEILSSGKTEGKLSKREKRKQRKADGTMGSKHIKAIGAQGLDLPQEAIERMGEGMITKPFEKHVDWTEEEQTLALARKDETMRSKADAEVRWPACSSLCYLQFRPTTFMSLFPISVLCHTNL
jgi:hypothetical protein